MNEIQKYISKNESKMLEDLFSLIRIPSISAKPEHHDDMLACAERWAQLLIEAGADEAEDSRSYSKNSFNICALRRDARRAVRTVEK